jgi:hypothetical protein
MADLYTELENMGGMNINVSANGPVSVSGKS